jgi:hypothetical protein
VVVWIPLSRTHCDVDYGVDFDPTSNHELNDFLDWRQFEWQGEPVDFESGLFAPKVAGTVIERLLEDGLNKYTYFSGIHGEEVTGEDDNFGFDEFQKRNSENTLDDLYLIKMDHQLRVLARFGDPVSMLRLAHMRAKEHEFDSKANHLLEAQRWFCRYGLFAGSIHDDEPELDIYLEEWRRVLQKIRAETFELTKKLPYPADLVFDEVCRSHGEPFHSGDDQTLCLWGNDETETQPQSNQVLFTIDAPEGLTPQHPNFCADCGDKLREVKKFCPNCGARI